MILTKINSADCDSPERDFLCNHCVFVYIVPVHVFIRLDEKYVIIICRIFIVVDLCVN